MIVEDLHEVYPHEFSETSEPSRFYVLYDQHAIYIASRFWDSDPDSVPANILRKGDFGFGDDTASVILDPHNNGRSGYVFDLNPNGVRTEAIFTNATRENWAWQGIWHGAAKKDSEGWVAEFEIPFKTLSFDPSKDTWGINFTRWRARWNEYYGWVSHNNKVNPAHSGKLKGMVGINQGLGLDIVPGFNINERKDFVASQSITELKSSVDVFYRITPALTAALTVNTDFSGTGVDARQINLSRFNLFFSERRNFFLQDTDIFEFGRIGDSEMWPPVTSLSQVEQESGRPFFSRKIGLNDTGETIDLEFGGKLTGRIGRWDIGLLSIRQAGYSNVDPSNLFVGRIAANILAESLIGAIVTKGNPTSNIDNTLLGIDFRYLNTRLVRGGTIEGAIWYQQTETDGFDDDNSAFGLKLKMPNGKGFRGGIEFKEIQTNFNPALGFVNRTNIRDYSLEFGHLWHSANQVIRTIYSGIDAERIDTIEGELQSQIITIRPFELETASQDRLRTYYSMNKEQIIEPFEISKEIFIPVGIYSFNQYCIDGSSGSHRSLNFSSLICSGEFYSGDNTNFNNQLTWRPNRHFKFSLGYDVYDIDLPQGGFITRLASLRADIAFTSTWSWENFIQYDNVSDSLGLNSILRWLPRAGREMIFMINRGFQNSYQMRNFKLRNFKSVSSDLAFKANYTFRF